MVGDHEGSEVTAQQSSEPRFHQGAPGSTGGQEDDTTCVHKMHGGPTEQICMGMSKRVV